ncbi:hypothetical protein [Alloalcanivorax mobilis]|uniref:hypothetical protein n=1 Tax=Alloalcanivorax mobilis TaxID=2019569 RepID=UPI000C770E2C|nr:hypothetical protein [Alloalcanivorax mobilis]
MNNKENNREWVFSRRLLARPFAATSVALESAARVGHALSTQQDEWILIAVGALPGFLVGELQVHVMLHFAVVV